jgi:hypothetical protein
MVESVADLPMATLPVFVNVVWDPTLGYNTHTWWCPAQTAAPPPGVPKPCTFNPAIEMIATQMWTAGYALGQNKFTTTVLHLGMPICIADHDVGILIPDLTIPPPNLWYVIQWPFSGRKMATVASTVQMNGQPVSCSQLAILPLPMLTCGDPLTLPLAFPLVNWTHTLTVGATAGDLFRGVINAVVTIAIDALFEWGVPGVGKLISRRLGREAGERAAKTLGPALLSQFLGKLGLTPTSFAKRVVSALAGWATSAASGNPTFSVGVGGGPVPQIGVQAGGTPDSGVVGSTTVGGVPVSVVGSNTPTNDPLNIF